MLPKKAKSQGFDFPVRPLGEKEDSIVWVSCKIDASHCTSLVSKRPQLQRERQRHKRTKQYKDKTIQRQNNTMTKQQKEEKIIRKSVNCCKCKRGGV